METYIWVVVIIFGFGAVVKTACLVSRFVPPRSNVAVAADVAVGVCLVVWGAVLLYGA